MNSQVDRRSNFSTRGLADRAIEYITQTSKITVKELYTALCVEYPQLTERQVTDLILCLVREGKVDLDEIRPSATSLARYLRMWEMNVYFYVSLAISFGAILAIYTIPAEFPFVLIRWVLGSVFVLFIPGYVAVQALFDSPELDFIARIALSIGLSAALTMFVGFLLNYTLWGITLTPILISLIAVTVLLDIIAVLRRYSRT